MIKSYAIDNSIFKRKSEQGSVIPSNWWKAEPGKYKVRILPPYSEEGRVFRSSANHSGNMIIKHSQLMLKDQNIQPTCLSFLFNGDSVPQSVIMELKKQFKISKTDYDMWKKYGCPICEIGQVMKLVSEDTNLKYAFFPKMRYFANLYVYEKGQTFKFGFGYQIYKAICSTYESNTQFNNINIFDPERGKDAVLTVEGQKSTRRYGIDWLDGLTAVPEDAKLFNLDECLIEGVKDFKTIVEAITQNEFTKHIVKEHQLLKGYGEF